MVTDAAADPAQLRLGQTALIRSLNVERVILERELRFGATSDAVTTCRARMDCLLEQLWAVIGRLPGR